MKIIVDGNLVDIEYIYNITEVGNAQYNTVVNKHNDKAVYAGMGMIVHLLFRINFLNKKHIDISVYECISDKKSGDELYSFWEEKRDEQYLKINTLRNKVVDVWLKNQTEIPKFDF